MLRSKLLRSTTNSQARNLLRKVYASTICCILLFVICIEYYTWKTVPLSTVPHYEEHLHFNRFSLKLQDFNFSGRYQFKSSKIEALSEHEQYHRFLLESRANSNKTFFVFNDTRTFRKLFRTWLESRSLPSEPLSVAFTENNQQACPGQGLNLSLFIAVTSSTKHSDARTAIRESWGGLANQKGARVVFFLGLPTRSKYHSQILEENRKFHDIVQAAFLDTYYNLTLKTISVLKWVSDNCHSVKYVLKVDDDMFINVDNFLTIARKEGPTAILGELAHEWSPVRSQKNKWYTSYSDYPFNIYPDFVFGPSYLMTGDAIPLFYEESRRMKSFHLEDVYITGFVAEKVGVQRVHLPAMFNTPRDLQPCSFKALLSSHGHTPPDMRRHWMWLTKRNFKCSSNLQQNTTHK